MRPRSVAEKGLSLAQMTATAYAAWRWAQAGKDEAGDVLPLDLPGTRTEAFENAVRRCLYEVDEAKDRHWTDVAKIVYTAYAATLVPNLPAWEEITPRLRKAWEALCRHIVNMLALEGEGDLDAHERTWDGYADGKKVSPP